MRRPQRAGASDAPQADGAARSQRFHETFPRILWALILSPPLIACMALAALTLTHKPVAVNTGDALLDAYLQAVLERDVELTDEPTRDRIWNRHIDYDALPEDAWRKLEYRFGQDPRFWMLCYNRRDGWYKHVATDNAMYFSQIAGVDLNPNCRFLEEARERKVVDLPVLLSLYWGYRSAWRNVTALDSLKLTRPARNASPKDVLSFESQLRKAIDARHGDAERELLNEIYALAPDSALPKYSAALDEELRGNPAHALALIREGNRLARQPANDTEHQNLSFADQYLALAGADDLAASWLPTTGRGFAPPIFQSQLQPPVQALVTAAIASHDTVMLEELHLMSCNIAREVGFDKYQTLFSEYSGQLIASAAPQVLGYSLAKNQSADLAELTKVLAQIKAERKNVFQRNQSIGQGLAQPAYMQEIALLLAGKQHWAISVLQANAQCLQYDKEYRAKMDELYSKLERFDYVTLSWREEPVLP